MQIEYSDKETTDGTVRNLYEVLPSIQASYNLQQRREQTGKALPKPMGELRMKTGREV